MQPLTKLGAGDVDTAESQALNQRAARSSLVLLLNGGSTLPLASRGLKMAVIGAGDHAATPSAILGTHFKGYACADNTLSCVMSPLQALQQANAAAGNGTTVYAKGCELQSGSPTDLAAAVAAAKAADVSVIVLGIDGKVENEAHDRTAIDLPGAQHELAKAVLALGKPTVIVLFNGGMVAVEEEMTSTNPNVAIIEAFYPGAVGGKAIADLIFGAFSPSAKLPYTLYKKGFVNETLMTEHDLVS
jgi:hypothetical protein